MDKDGYCWPGRDLLAKETSLDVRTIGRALNRLETGQWLRIKHARPAVNRYWATFPQRGTESHSDRGTESHSTGHRSSKQDTESLSNGAQSPTNSSVEEFKNPSDESVTPTDEKPTDARPVNEQQPANENWFEEHARELNLILNDI